MSAASANTALITGASGFVGSHLCRHLVAKGWRVHIIARPSSDLTLLLDSAAKVEVHRFDGATENLSAIVAETRPDVVFHLASLFLSQHKPADIAPLVQSNVLFGTQLLEAMSAQGIQRLVNTGTSWQHFESRDYGPVNLYAATKQAFEAILQYYVETASLRVITLKLFDTYGPDDPRPKLFSLLRKLKDSGQPLAMSPGEQLIDLVYIDDVSRAFEMAAERLLGSDVSTPESYAVSSGNPMRLRDLVEAVEKEFGAPLPIQWGARAYRAREVMTTWNRGAGLPGWSPMTSLAEGIRKTLADSPPTP